MRLVSWVMGWLGRAPRVRGTSASDRIAHKDLWRTIKRHQEIPVRSRRDTFHAVASAAPQRDLGTLTKTIARLMAPGVAQWRAGAISRFLVNRVNSVLDAERQLSLGITEATWMYSGAPCIDPREEWTDAYRAQDAAHKAANGKRFKIRKGMYVDGRWTWPGREEGCKCVSRRMIKGFS